MTSDSIFYFFYYIDILRRLIILHVHLNTHVAVHFSNIHPAKSIDAADSYLECGFQCKKIKLHKLY